MGQTIAGTRRARLLSYTRGFGLWLLILVLSLVDFIWWRGTTELLISTLIERKAIDSLAGPFYLGVLMLFIGGGLFALVLLGESYLRTGAIRRELRHRFTRLVVPLVVAFVIGALIRAVA